MVAMISTPTRLAIAAEEHSDEPALPTTGYDLSETTRQGCSSKTWHTGGTLPTSESQQNQLLRGGEG